MEAQVRAGIDILGSTLRYAEIVQYGRRYSLQRLGSCEFEHDIVQELLFAETPAHLDVVSDAINDVFAGSKAVDFRFALHPPGCYSFFTPLPTDMALTLRQERLEYEAALLTQPATVGPYRLTADATHTEALDDGQRMDWFHVLAVEEHVHARFDELLRGWGQVKYRLMVSMQGAAAALYRQARRAERPIDPDKPFSLLIGWYPTHVEYTVCYQRQWYFSHHTAPGPPADAAYFSMALLKQLKLVPSIFGEVYIYGLGVNMGQFAVLEKVFKVRPAGLNPLRVVDLPVESLAASFDVEQYVPSIGTAL